MVAVAVAVAVADIAVLLETTIIDQRPNILISILVSIMADHFYRTVSRTGTCREYQQCDNTVRRRDTPHSNARMGTQYHDIP